MLMSQVPAWAGVAILALAVGFYLWRTRAVTPSVRLTPLQVHDLDPHLALQQEILRGILRREGLLPPPPPQEQGVIDLPLRYRLVPVPPADQGGQE